MSTSYLNQATTFLHWFLHPNSPITIQNGIYIWWVVRGWWRRKTSLQTKDWLALLILFLRATDFLVFQTCFVLIWPLESLLLLLDFLLLLIFPLSLINSSQDGMLDGEWERVKKKIQEPTWLALLMHIYSVLGQLIFLSSKHVFFFASSRVLFFHWCFHALHWCNSDGN